MSTQSGTVIKSGIIPAGASAAVPGTGRGPAPALGRGAAQACPRGPGRAAGAGRDPAPARRARVRSWGGRAIMGRPGAAIWCGMKSRAEKLAESRRRTHNLQVAQMRPGRSPERLELLRNLERSQRAATKLHQKALEHEQRRAASTRPSRESR